MHFLEYDPRQNTVCASVEELQTHLSSILQDNVKETRAEQVCVGVELCASTIFELRVTESERTALETVKFPRKFYEVIDSHSGGPCNLTVAASDCIAHQPQDDPTLQELVAERIASIIGSLDGSVWLKQLTVRGAQGWILSFICKASSQAWLQALGKTVRPVVAECSSCINIINKSRPAFDCCGNLKVSFQESSQTIIIKYEHLSFHKTVAELLALCPIEPTDQARGQSTKERVSPISEKLNNGDRTVPQPGRKKRKLKSADGCDTVVPKGRKKLVLAPSQFAAAVTPDAKALASRSSTTKAMSIVQEQQHGEPAQGNVDTCVGKKNAQSGTSAEATRRKSEVHTVLENDHRVPCSDQRNTHPTRTQKHQISKPARTVNFEILIYATGPRPSAQHRLVGKRLDGEPTTNTPAYTVTIPVSNTPPSCLPLLRQTSKQAGSQPHTPARTAVAPAFREEQQPSEQLVLSPKLTPTDLTTHTPTHLQTPKAGDEHHSIGLYASTQKLEGTGLKRSACTSCRTRVVLCSRQKPACDACVSAGIICKYPPISYKMFKKFPTSRRTGGVGAISSARTTV